MVVSWLKSLFAAGNGEKPSAKPDVRCRPGVEALESRLVPVTNVTDLTVITPQVMVTTLLGSGSGLNVSNITYTGDNRASGIYSGGAASINLESGIVLSSGRAVGAIGPNNQGGFTGNNGLPGDPDLAAIVAPALTFDASE